MAKREINRIMREELSRKATVADIEGHVQRMLDCAIRTHQPPQQIAFWRGAVRTFEVLRKAGLLKE